MSATKYYAVELSLYKGQPLYIELDATVADYHKAIDKAVEKATQLGYIDGWEDVKCERELFECMK